MSMKPQKKLFTKVITKTIIYTGIIYFILFNVNFIYEEIDRQRIRPGDMYSGQGNFLCIKINMIDTTNYKCDRTTYLSNLSKEYLSELLFGLPIVFFYLLLIPGLWSHSAFIFSEIIFVIILTTGIFLFIFFYRRERRKQKPKIAKDTVLISKL